MSVKYNLEKDAIEIDAFLLPIEQIDEKHEIYKSDLIDKLVKAIDKLPPIDVYKSSVKNGRPMYKIIDGFHRFTAHLILNKKQIKINVMKGIPDPDDKYWDEEI